MEENPEAEVTKTQVAMEETESESDREAAPEHRCKETITAITDTCCKRCEVHLNEIRKLKSEILNMKLKLPAESHSTETKDAMHILLLERNNTALIAAVEALSKQLVVQGPPISPITGSNNQDSDEIQITKATNNPAGVPAESERTSSTAKKKRAKKRKAKKTKASRSDSTEPEASSNGHTLAEREAAEIINGGTVKNVVAIVGDSMVKDVIGQRMSAKDPDHHFVVKSIAGANLEDMEDYIKPQVRRAPAKLILHVGTNDVKKLSPQAIANSTMNLVAQVRDNSPETNVGISALLVRSDNSSLASKIKQVNAILKEYCNLKKIPFLSNSNIKNYHLNSRGLHLNKKGSLVLESNLVEFAKNLSA